MFGFGTILNFVTKYKGLMYFILGGILIAILLAQCNKIEGLKAEKQAAIEETIRVVNNHEADTATIRQLRLENGTLQAEKQGYALTIDELLENKKELLGQIKIEKNNVLKAIANTTIIYKDSIKEVPVYVRVDSLGNAFAEFEDSVNFGKGNFRKFSGELPYELRYFSKADSTEIPEDSLDYKSNPVFGGGTFLIQQGMVLRTALFQDKKTKKVMIKVETDYPGVSFVDIQGASILDNKDDAEHRKAMRKMRKPFGIGLGIGYGVGINVMDGSFFHGPVISIGFKYTPKWAQWGN